MDPDPRLRPLRGRRVVLGVSGGIAAYKAVEVCRRLVDAGAHVAPILTQDALRFVGALTFSALASEPRAHLALRRRRRSHPAHPPGPGRRPRGRRARHRQAAGEVRVGHLRRPPDRDAAGDAGTGAGRARDAHRDVGAPRRAGERRHPARAGGDDRRARPGPPRRRRSGRRAPGRARRHRPGRVVRPRPAGRPRRSARRGDRRRHPGAARPGAVRREPLVREDGPRRRRRRIPARRGRDAGDDGPPRARRRGRGGAASRPPRRCTTRCSNASPMPTWW